MSFEYYCLTLMTILFMCAWIPASYGKMKSYGPDWVASNRDPSIVQTKALVPWAGRVDRAHINLKDNFPAFVVAILLLGILKKFDYLTTCAAGIYVTARIAHFISYGVGNVPLRAGTFAISFFANLFLLIKIVI